MHLAEFSKEGYCSNRAVLPMMIMIMIKHNRSEMVTVLGPYEALPYYIHIHT
jgi:hypothetical protein